MDQLSFQTTGRAMRECTDENWLRNAVRNRLVKTLSDIESIDLFHIILLDIEGADIQVACQTLWVVGLGNDRNIFLCGPPQEDLSGILVVLGGDLLNKIVLEERRNALIDAELNVGHGSKGGVRGDSNALALAPLHEVLLHIIRVQLDLENGGQNARVSLKIHHQRPRVVGDSDRLGQTCVYELFHCGVGLVQRNIDRLERLVIGRHPARRPADLRVDPFQRDWEMDVEELQNDGSAISACPLANNPQLTSK